MPNGCAAIRIDSKTMTANSLLNEQIAYYRARAAEYDQWHTRQGRYDKGQAHRRQWLAELDAVRSALGQAQPFGECLELACGTGLWTPQLAEHATCVTAIDVASETIAINRTKVGDLPVQYVVADLFEWWPKQRYDFVFFGFWLSHVPADRFDWFWEMVGAALQPGGRAYFVDGLPTQASTARDHASLSESGVEERKLNDGRAFRIVKLFYQPDQLQRRLQALGWTGNIWATGQFFYHGCVARTRAGRLRLATDAGEGPACD